MAPPSEDIGRARHGRRDDRGSVGSPTVTSTGSDNGTSIEPDPTGGAECRPDSEKRWCAMVDQPTPGDGETRPISLSKVTSEGPCALAERASREDRRSGEKARSRRGFVAAVDLGMDGTSHFTGDVKMSFDLGRPLPINESQTRALVAVAEGSSDRRR